MFSTITLLLIRLPRSQTARLVLLGLMFLLVGAVLFSLTQSVSFGTAMYWAVTTATTVGYGDVTPKNGAGRIVAVGVMLTTIPLFASAFATFAGVVASSRLRSLWGMADHDTTDRHVLIFGLHPSVPQIAAQLLRAGRQVVVVANADQSALPEGVQLVVGDPTTEHVVARSHPERAGQLLVTGADDGDTLLTALLVRQLAPDVPTLAVAQSAKVGDALRELQIATSVSADELLAHTLAKSLEAPHAGQMLLGLVNSDGYKLRELPVTSASIGQRLSEVRGRQSQLVLAAVHEDQVIFGVEDDPVLMAGDRLLVLDAEDG